MILTGANILDMHEAGRIIIDPFVSDHVGVNSVDLRLSAELLVYTSLTIDMAMDNPVESVTIPEEGLVMYPGDLYLGSTIERCGSDEFVTCIEGRSSVGRLGISVHAAAGFGDLGFKGCWTLEITVVKPVRVYSGVRICQAYFCSTLGERWSYSGKYQQQSGPVSSRMFRDFGRMFGD